MTKKYVLPVIHVESKEQTFNNVTIARECGANGVFLISHGMMDADELIQLALEVKKNFNPIWVGINCLDLDAKEAAKVMPDCIDGIWTDNAKIDERVESQTYAEEVWEIFKQRLPHTLYFGGVAFKYQRMVTDLETAVRKAAPLMDVICTSGPGTGFAADQNKIKRMVGIAPLAIASGITPENVGAYLPYVDYFLVATGISDNFTDINPDKLRSLVGHVKGWKSEQQ
ncbi:MAG: hypothetical protein LUD17_11130 [Bacteroidales bacterium]|nr:hypothetical protein [Bacteroidales bacterium]